MRYKVSVSGELPAMAVVLRKFRLCDLEGEAA